MVTCIQIVLISVALHITSSLALPLKDHAYGESDTDEYFLRALRHNVVSNFLGMPKLWEIRQEYDDKVSSNLIRLSIQCYGPKNKEMRH